MPLTHFSQKISTALASNRMDSKRSCAIIGIITFSSKFPFAPAQLMVTSLPMTCAHHHERLAHDRVYFPRHDRAARLRGGQSNFANAASRSAPEPANVVGD